MEVLYLVQNNSLITNVKNEKTLGFSFTNYII
jgi:hypothetical protein